MSSTVESNKVNHVVWTPFKVILEQVGQTSEDVFLTQNRQVGFGCSDWHGEERTGVHALVRQRDITDADGQLRPGRVDQLDPVVP